MIVIDIPENLEDRFIYVLLSGKCPFSTTSCKYGDKYKDCKTCIEKDIRDFQSHIPNLISDGYADGHPVYDEWECNCGAIFDIENHYKYCPECGTKINWETIDG